MSSSNVCEHSLERFVCIHMCIFQLMRQVISYEVHVSQGLVQSGERDWQVDQCSIWNYVGAIPMSCSNTEGPARKQSSQNITVCHGCRSAPALAHPSLSHLPCVPDQPHLHCVSDEPHRLLSVAI